jgi:hypothetical protein
MLPWLKFSTVVDLAKPQDSISKLAGSETLKEEVLVGSYAVILGVAAIHAE